MKKDLTPGTIYTEAVKTLPACDIDHHAADLYIRKTPASDAIIARLNNKALLSTFRDGIDGSIWYDLPFCFIPFWEAEDKSKHY